MPIRLLVPAATLIALAILARWIGKWLSYRGDRLITCTENRRPAGVRVDAPLAALTAWPTARLRLDSCSRWPERAGCGQQCLREIAESPDGCFVRNILASWYEGKACVSCGHIFSEIRREVQKPALLRADKTSVEWKDIPVDRLVEELQHSAPLCFACHMASTLVREHPDLAIRRVTEFRPLK